MTFARRVITSTPLIKEALNRYIYEKLETTPAQAFRPNGVVE
jgi:hypothetical protein